MLEGSDVSHWNEVGTYHGSFVYAKATQGLGYTDPKFAAHKAAIKARGLVFLGGYHFLETGDGAAQFDHFNAVSSDGLAILDWESYESPIGSGIWHKASKVTAEAWLNAAKKKGRDVVIYGSATDVHSISTSVRARIIAAYSGAPAKPWDIWQYDGTGLDLDRFDGTLAKLKELVGQTSGGGFLAKLTDAEQQDLYEKVLDTHEKVLNIWNFHVGASATHKGEDGRYSAGGNDQDAANQKILKSTKL